MTCGSFAFNAHEATMVSLQHAKAKRMNKSRLVSLYYEQLSWKTLMKGIRKQHRAHLHLLARRVAAAAAAHAGLGHVALEDAIFDVLRVVLLALLGIQAAEDDALAPLVELSAEEEEQRDYEDDAPFPVESVS